jgi:hypothetical protein
MDLEHSSTQTTMCVVSTGQISSRVHWHTYTSLGGGGGHCRLSNYRHRGSGI